MIKPRPHEPGGSADASIRESIVRDKKHAAEASALRSRNPWPIAIVSFFAVFITFIAVFIGFASRQRMDLVRANYYEDEILYQEQIDRLKRTQPIRSEVMIAYDSAQECFKVTLPVSSSVAGRLHLYRPSNATLDREFELAVKPDGTQQIKVKNLSAGLWKVRLNWKANDQEYYFDQSVVIGPRPL